MSAEERERRQQRGELWSQINAALKATRANLHGTAGCYTGSPSFWFHRHCKAVLGASPNAMDNVQLPDALALATWMRDAAAKFDRAAPAGMTYEARGAAARDLLRRAADEYRAQVAPAAGPKWKGPRSVPLKAPAPQYEKSGRVQAPEKANPAGGQAGGVQVKQVSKQIQECRDVEKGNHNAAGPQQRASFPSLTVQDGKITIPLQFDDTEGMGLQAADFIEAARELFIDIQCDQERDCNITLAILGLRAAEAIVSHLTEIARHAPEVRA